MELLANASEEQQRKVFHNATAERLAKFDVQFENWADDSQHPPPGEGWRVWLMMAGRGFGKTRAGAEWIHGLAEAKPGARIALVGATIADARTVMIEGVSGLLAVAKMHRRRRLNWEPSLGRLRWPNGSEAQLFSGDNADGLRGPEHDFAWFLTFELIADPDAPSIADILADASAGRIDCEGAAPITGYAALGRSIAVAVEPLVEHFGVHLFDDGERLRSPTAALVVVSAGDFGNSAGDEPAGRIEREQVAGRSLPTALSLTYYDHERDFQSGLVRTSIADQDGNEEQDELPAVMSATDARALVEDSLARRWAERDKLTLRLPPKYVGLEPGAILQLELAPSLWEVRRCTVEAMVALVELRPAWNIASELEAEAGRVSSEPDIVTGPVTLALVDAPLPIADPASAPTVYLAASTPTAGWKAPMVEVAGNGFTLSARAARRKAVLGEAIDALIDGQACLIDAMGSVEIQLIDEAQWLTSCDDDALVEGANLALLGDELVQFGAADAIGPGRFRLSRLLRGRVGTEWAMGSHAAGEKFVLIETSALQPLTLPAWMRGASLTVSQAGGSGASVSTTVEAESLRPPSPVDLRAAIAGGALSASWTRRSRSGFAWVDDVDAPVGEPFEKYAVNLAGPGGTIDRETEAPALSLSAAELAAAGSGAAVLTVRQIGGWAASRPAQTSLTLP